jgi:hypothetical protein
VLFADVMLTVVKKVIRAGSNTFGWANHEFLIDRTDDPTLAWAKASY